MKEFNRDLTLALISESGVLPFSYSEIDSGISFGGRIIEVTPEWELDAQHILSGERLLHADELLNHTLVFGGVARIFGLPLMRRGIGKLSDQQKVKLQDKTAEIMKTAYVEVAQGLHGDNFIEDPLDGKFRVNLFTYPAPNLIIDVHTSIGPWAEGDIGEPGWDHGFTELITNNEELVEDRAALFVGLGFIADQVA